MKIFFINVSTSLLLVLLFLSSCEIVHNSTYETFYLSEDLLKQYKFKVIKYHDAEAAIRVADYYFYCDDDYESFLFWFEKAAALGSKEATNTELEKWKNRYNKKKGQSNAP